jgi:hypothetical protein
VDVILETIEIRLWILQQRRGSMRQFRIEIRRALKPACRIAISAVRADVRGFSVCSSRIKERVFKFSMSSAWHRRNILFGTRHYMCASQFTSISCRVRQQIPEAISYYLVLIIVFIDAPPFRWACFKPNNIRCQRVFHGRYIRYLLTSDLSVERPTRRHAQTCSSHGKPTGGVKETRDPMLWHCCIVRAVDDRQTIDGLQVCR